MSSNLSSIIQIISPVLKVNSLSSTASKSNKALTYYCILKLKLKFQ